MRETHGITHGSGARTAAEAWRCGRGRRPEGIVTICAGLLAGRLVTPAVAVPWVLTRGGGRGRPAGGGVRRAVAAVAGGGWPVAGGAGVGGGGGGADGQRDREGVVWGESGDLGGRR